MDKLRSERGHPCPPEHEAKMLRVVIRGCIRIPVLGVPVFGDSQTFDSHGVSGSYKTSKSK